ncbi:unnamed protein product [Prorocentrum cordatum]|uniref:Uncharacterized protein n=1 Tax=Prorocentrum cordatum TaxID=2364126 RepID=A0ABN9QXX9_9DINO|nr:unnamed protein product [Polarella glacialis]
MSGIGGTPPQDKGRRIPAPAPATSFIEHVVLVVAPVTCPTENAAVAQAPATFVIEHVVFGLVIQLALLHCMLLWLLCRPILVHHLLQRARDTLVSPSSWPR